ncbi:M20/M25/M40 family metallo-hydrolase [Paraglaciecola sp.]|uniref:M20/M25/M40 family metallo-hydrolase n=1 Tax=Paraglaciecola sp. TaxID=1920173 RepID=UPI0030F499EB
MVFCRSCFSCEQNNLCGRTRFVIPVDDIAALVVCCRGDGRSGKKPILLSAQMNVVDACPDDWQRDPFTLIEENGYYFGRGTADDKFSVSVLTTTFLRLTNLPTV